MKKFFICFAGLIVGCVLLGFIVSKLEKEEISAAGKRSLKKIWNM